MEIINITLAANETKQFRRGGVGLEILASSFAVTVNTYSQQGGQTNTMKGALSGLFVNCAFGAFDITNGANAQTVQLLVLDAGEGGGSRRMALAGSVSVSDAGIAAVSAGQAFMGSTLMSASAAGYGASILYNAGTKTVYVDRLGIINGGTNVALFLGMQSTAAPTAGAQQAGCNYNKDVNGAAATAQLWAQVQNATKWVPTKRLMNFQTTSNSFGNTQKFPLIEGAPLRLLAGQSVGVSFDAFDGTGNVTEAFWEWREV